jgi:MFS family permease
MPADDPLFLARLSKTESATLLGTFLGWMLDGLDVMIFSLVMPTLISIWSISQSQAGLLGTSTLMLSAFGGWLAGLAADRYGRVRVLQLTIVWFSVFTFLSGFTNGFGQLLLTRSLQGLGFGGEWAVGAVLIAETIRGEYRGKAVGIVQSGWAIGWGIAALCYAVLFSTLAPALAWRAMFWIGLLPALLVIYIQRHVPESAVFERKVASRESPAGPLEIFSGGLWTVTLRASLVALGAQGGYYAITTWLPLYLQKTRGLSVMAVGTSLFVIITGSFLGYLVSAWCTDRLGRRLTLILFAMGSFATICAYMFLALSDAQSFYLGFVLGFASSGVFSPIGAFFAELFPTRVRGSGQGFSYNLGRGAGALFPALVGVLSTHIALGSAIAVFAAGAYLLMIIGVLSLPETQHRGLA